MKNNIKGFVFDLDGVIVSTDKFHYQAWKAVSDEQNIYFDEKINDRLRGVSRMASLEIILEKASRSYTEEEKIAIAEKKNGIYRELLKNLTPNDRLIGVTETLDYLRAQGYKLSIGSSSKNTPLILEKIGYKDFFDAVSDGNNITHSKPNPEVFLKASDMIKLSPDVCCVVEDSRAGIEAANNGNFKSIAIGDAKEAKASTWEINKMSDIIKLF